MELVDTHCHLYEDPMGGQPGAVLERAAAAGVTRVVVPAYDLGSWPRALELSRRQGVFAALGLHPWVAAEPLDLAVLRVQLRAPGVVALGEVGLDFALPEVDRRRQLQVLEQQLELARELDLPLILHCRKAFEELAGLLRRFPGVRGVLHAFSRGSELASRFVDLGLHLGIGGAVTRPRAKRLRRAVLRVPPQRLVLETDAPSIGLDGVEPRQVEPRHVAEIAGALAGLLGESPQRVARVTTDNACRLFGL